MKTLKGVHVAYALVFFSLATTPYTLPMKYWFSHMVLAIAVAGLCGKDAYE